MHIIVIGIDHTRASIDLRERLACSPQQASHVLEAAHRSMQESVLLSTCNRLELYGVCPVVEEGKARLLEALSESRGVELAELQSRCYSYVDEQAVAHLFGVACGLYSQVPGESQIQGQVAQALELAQSGGYAGPITSALFRAALVAGKRARRETGISRNAASISHVAVQLARHHFPNLNEASVLLVGSGKMSELTVHNLCDSGAHKLMVVNRTEAHAIDLARRFGAIQRPFTELLEALVEADVVISSTSSSHTIIATELMQRVMERRHGRPLLLIDIALPRDIDPDAGALPGVHLYNLDDLRAEADEGIRLRVQEAAHVQAIIDEEVASFERWLRSLSVVDTIHDLRQHIEKLREEELVRALRRLGPALTEREAAVVQELATRLVNKLLHAPTLRLKEAAANGQGELYAETLRYLFALEENTNETDYNRDKSQQTGDDPDTGSDRAIAAALARAGDSYRADPDYW